MKKYLGVLVLIFANITLVTYADTLGKEGLAADFLAYKDIIVSQEMKADYKLTSEITRREMAKVTLNLSGKNINNTCLGKYTDFDTDDWGCKYAEAGLGNGYFAKNEKFDPNNSISKVEALKMIMQGRSIKKSEAEDWREGYVLAGVDGGLLEEAFTDYDSIATRGWIFLIAQHAIEYSEDEDIKLIEDLLGI